MLAALLLAGCIVDSTSTAVEDIGGTWTVVRVGNQPAVPMDEPRLQFTDSDTVLRGTSGCRDLETSVHIEGNSMRLGRVTAQGIAGCLPQVIRFEAVFLSALESVRTFTVGEGRMRLEGPGTEIVAVTGELELTDAEKELESALEAEKWRILDATGVAQPALIPAIEFLSGRVLADGRCGFAGRYRLRGDDLIQFYDMTIREAADCPPATARDRTDLVELLESTTVMTFEHARSQLRLSGDRHEIRLSSENAV